MARSSIWNPGSQLQSDLANTDDVAKGDAMIGVRQPFIGAVGRTQHDKNSDIISALDFGQINTGLVDATAALNLVLLGGNRSIHIPAGVYLVTDDLRLYPNTEVYGDGDATIFLHAGAGEGMWINGERGNTNFATGYNGVGNLLLRDFKVAISDINFSSSQKAYFQFGHGKNIVVNNVTHDRLYRGHFIEFNACQDSFADNCRFSDQVALSDDAARDAINIDFAYATGFPAFGAYDGTVCDNVGVRNSVFRNVHSGPGSHGASATAHTNIKICNNLMENIALFGVWGRWWNDSLIENNTIKNTGDKGIYIQSSNRVVERNNVVTGPAQIVNTHGIQFQDCINCSHDGGTVRKGIYTANFQYALRSFGGNGNFFYSKGLDSGSSGVYSLTSPNNLIDDCYIYTINDDTVLAVPVPIDKVEGFVIVLSRSASLVTTRAGYYYRATGGSPVLTLLYKAVGATSAEATGPLTGTTGADGIMTCSVDGAGNFYVENRRGSAITVSVKFEA